MGHWSASSQQGWDKARWIFMPRYVPQELLLSSLSYNKELGDFPLKKTW
jgi:hypothetical protein